VSSPSKTGDAVLRKKILQRVNQRYSSEFGEGSDAVEPESAKETAQKKYV